jgi:uncharacterized membrane protein YjjP (DUF1212 family)
MAQLRDIRSSDSEAQSPAPVPPAEALELVIQGSSLLFVNAATTEQTINAGARIALALGHDALIIPRWGELAVRVRDEHRPLHDITPVSPVAIDMDKVLATSRTIDLIFDRTLGAEAARSAFAKIDALPPVSLGRFTLAAAVGACALAVVFGATHAVTFPLIAFSAGGGALLRRGLSHVSRNLFIQPLAAGLLAGLVGGLAQRAGLSSSLALVAVCPCMVLVPGPHFLNGLMDLARARLALGSFRLAYAGLVVVAISAGLFLGLGLVGGTLPVSPPSRSIPLWIDVTAAASAVAAYASFYSMPWRYVPLPLLVGATAHALRWWALATGATSVAAAFLACLFVGLVMSPLGNRLRLPYAALSFAAVVSLIPGVFLFRMGSGLVQLAVLGEKAPPGLPFAVIADWATAVLTLLAMGSGLILPKLWAQGSRLEGLEHGRDP